MIDEEEYSDEDFIDGGEEELDFEPEYCSDGESDGVECEPIVKDGAWFCNTCNQWM